MQTRTLRQPSGQFHKPSRSPATASGGSGRPQRRRRVDPTTCERDYGAEEIEFMRAVEHYKHRSGRMFPTCSELLEVVRSLGYVRPAGLVAGRG
jgi:hypothetical protein